MQIKIINPNTTSSMTDSIAECARRVAGPGVLVTASNPATGPESIECHLDEALAVPGVVDEVRQGELEGVDGYVIACFGDPGVLAAREIARGPVIGVAEAAMRTALHLGRTFTVVTTLERTLGRAQDIAHAIGAERAAVGWRAVEIPVLQIERDPEVYSMMLKACQEAAQADRCDSIVLGCAGFGSLASTLTHDLGIPVIDGVAAATVTVRGLIDLGLSTSRAREFAAPPLKQYA